jgi:hypothetical protein
MKYKARVCLESPAAAAGAVEEGVGGVAGQGAEGDRAQVGEDLGNLGIVVAPAQALDRIRIDSIAMLGIMLGGQDRRGLGRVLRSKRISRTALSAEVFFSMGFFSFRSWKPSLGSSLQTVQSRLTGHTGGLLALRDRAAAAAGLSACAAARLSAAANNRAACGTHRTRRSNETVWRATTGGGGSRQDTAAS